MFPPTRRVVNLYVTPELLEGLFFPSRPGVWHRTDAGLPEGALCTGRWYDYERNRFVFQFAHESFREVPEGCAIPEFRGVEMSAFCFDSPADAASIAILNGLTAQQIDREQVRLNRLATAHGEQRWKLDQDTEAEPIPSFVADREAKLLTYERAVADNRESVANKIQDKFIKDFLSIFTTDPDAPHIVKEG